MSLRELFDVVIYVGCAIAITYYLQPVVHHARQLRRANAVKREMRREPLTRSHLDRVVRIGDRRVMR